MKVPLYPLWCHTPSPTVYSADYLDKRGVWLPGSGGRLTWFVAASGGVPVLISYTDWRFPGEVFFLPCRTCSVRPCEVKGEATWGVKDIRDVF